MDKNRKFSEMQIQQCIQNDVVVNFNDVIRIRHSALNIESKQPVAILTFEWTSLVRKRKKCKAVLFCSIKDARLERLRFFKYYYNSIA